MFYFARYSCCSLLLLLKHISHIHDTKSIFPDKYLLYETFCHAMHAHIFNLKLQNTNNPSMSHVRRFKEVRKGDYDSSTKNGLHI